MNKIFPKKLLKGNIDEQNLKYPEHNYSPPRLLMVNNRQNTLFIRSA